MCASRSSRLLTAASLLDLLAITTTRLFSMGQKDKIVHETGAFGYRRGSHRQVSDLCLVANGLWTRPGTSGESIFL